MKEDVEADIAAIKEIVSQYMFSCNAGDFDLFISLWSNEGIQMPNDTPARIGKAQIIEAMKPSFRDFIMDIYINSIEEVRIFGDIGLTRCSYNLYVTPKAGGDKLAIEPDGKALTIYQRQIDGKWKIIYDCFNSNVSPAQQ